MNMTALSIATDIPSDINTLEKLALWVGLALSRVNPTTKYLEVPDAEPQRDANVVLIKCDDGKNRTILRIAIPIIDGYASNTAKFWQNAEIISDTALPTAFKAN